MKRIVLLFALGCANPKPEPEPATPPRGPSTQPSQPAQPAQPSQNEQLYAKGEALEKAGKWEEAANTYQKYVFAMGDALSYMDRSSMELRIKQLREKAATQPAP